MEMKFILNFTDGESKEYNCEGAESNFAAIAQKLIEYDLDRNPKKLPGFFDLWYFRPKAFHDSSKFKVLFGMNATVQGKTLNSIEFYVNESWKYVWAKQSEISKGQYTGIIGWFHNGIKVHDDSDNC